ncbi:metallophosphoesterase [Allobaculum sp. Allo2]|nr:metallophosphoesterase [Allobaculum sp. Allo2]
MTLLKTGNGGSRIESTDYCGQRYPWSRKPAHRTGKAYPHADLFLHCGDLENSPEYFPAWIFVRGNNDYGGNRMMPDSRVVSYAGIRIYMTHSHRLGYYSRLEKLAALAKENDCQIAVFGHTHVPLIKKVNGVLLVNPGSMRFPRDGNSPCYAVIEVDDNDQIHAKLIHQEDWPFKPKNSWTGGWW